MNRRNFAGALGGFLALLMSPFRSRAAEPSPKNQRRYVIVQGGSIPTMDGDPSYQPVDHAVESESIARHPKGATFAKTEWYQEPFLQHPGLYPRYPSFSVMHAVNLGTIDELVKDYRRKLEIATGLVDADTVTTTPESVQAQQDRFDAKYPRGEAHEVNFDHVAWQNFLAARAQHYKLHGGHEPPKDTDDLDHWGAMKPSQLLLHIDVIGHLGRFGCSENEGSAGKIVQWLAANGDKWLTPFKLSEVVPHPMHWHESCCDDDPDYECTIERFLLVLPTGDHEVSPRFIGCVMSNMPVKPVKPVNPYLSGPRFNAETNRTIMPAAGAEQVWELPK